MSPAMKTEKLLGLGSEAPNGEVAADHDHRDVDAGEQPFGLRRHEPEVSADLLEGLHDSNTHE